MVVLLVLLVVAYIGGLWASSRKTRAFGSPSGVEYVVLGVLLGPHVLGSLTHGVLVAFEPLALVALAWIALGYGLECGMVGRRRARPHHLVTGVVCTALVMLAAATAVYWAAPGLPPDTRALLSIAVGLVSAESTRHGVRRIGNRYGAVGPLHRFLTEISAADDAPALLALPFVYAWFREPQRWLGSEVSPWLAAIATLATGGVVGLAAAWLMGQAASRVERWTILLGSAWFVAGVTESVGGSAMGACFALGLALSATSSEADALRVAVARTEGPVLLPALVLAGAHLSPISGQTEVSLVVFVTVARLLANFAVGAGIGLSRTGAARAAGWIGASMLTSGTLSMIVGFALTLRFPESVGQLTLTCAFVGTLLGELVGPLALRRALSSVGELSLGAGPKVAPAGTVHAGAEVRP